MPPPNLAVLGRRVREARLARRLTLEAVVARTDFTVSWLSKLENGQLSPSLEGLVRLADALGCGVETLVVGLSEPPNHVIDRNGDSSAETASRPASRNGASKGHHRKPLAEAWRGSAMQPERIRLSRKNGQAESDDGQRFVLVLEGRVLVTYGEDQILLEQGDSIYLNAAIPHGLTSLGKTEAEVLSVTCSLPLSSTPAVNSLKPAARRAAAAKTRGRASDRT